MKKTIFILILIALAFCAWLFLRQPTQKPKQNVEPQTQPSVTNAVTTPPTSNAPQNAASNSNAFVRPDSVDEATWNKWMAYRQLILGANQSVEFYARVIDQNDLPVEGAKLAVEITRMDETKFDPTNYLHWDPASSVQEKDFDVFSDSNGWIRLTGLNGSFLRVEALTKEGYLGKTYYGGISFKPNGVRNPSSDILMTNAWNPQKGYILHLQKIEGTNSMNSAK